MAAAVRYVTTRNGVYQYVRRVPESVKREPAHFAHHFGSKALFRASLKTKDQGQMHIEALAVHADFERRLSMISGKVIPVLCAAPPSSLRTVTQADLNDIAVRYRAVTVNSFERAFIRADASAADAAEYERILYNLENAAEEDVKALEARAGGGKASALMEDALWVIANDRWDAPSGSEAFGAIVGAIRAGTQQGRDDIQALIEGKRTPQLTAPRAAAKPAVPTLNDAVYQYLDHRKLPVRTEAEVKSSLRLPKKQPYWALAAVPGVRSRRPWRGAGGFRSPGCDTALHIGWRPDHDTPCRSAGCCRTGPRSCVLWP